MTHTLNSLSAQRGVATLTVALILLVSLTLLTLFASRVSVTEHQIAANDYRAKQAFEAAQAGIEIAFNNVGLTGDLTQAPAGGGTPALPAAMTAALDNGSSYSASFTYPSAANLQQILITSTGTSSDGSATKVLRQLLQYVPFQINNVNAGILAQGNVTLSGASNANNGGTAGIFSVRSGGAISAAAKNTTGPTLQNDASIPQNPDDFFKYIFGASRSEVQAAATAISCTTATCNTLEATTSQLIWLTGEGNINGNTTIGSATNPVVLIIDDGFRFNGNLTVYGLVYYTQNWVNRGGGTADVNGATVVEGGFQTTGTPGFNYNGAVLNNLQQDLGTFEKLAGGWRDF